MNITKALGFVALLNLAGCIHAQTQVDWNSQIKNRPTDFAYTDMVQTWTAQQNFGVITSTGAAITGASFLQNLVVPNGGYAQFPPLTYNPYGGSICVDKWGNIVTQPVPVTGATFGPEDVVLWNSTSPSMPFQNGTGSGLVQPVLYTNPASTNTGSCGIPLPVNTTYGLNTNGYFFGRAGLGTDLPAYNSIQSLQGGMTANSYTAGVLYPAGTLVCTTVVAGVCTMTTALVVPTYLGGHMDIGHSCGPPMAGSIAAATNPFSGGEGFVQGMVYWDDCLHYAQIRTDSSTWVRLNGNGGSASGGPTNSFQINDGSGGFIGYSALTYNSGTNIVTMTGTAGQGMIAPLFNANAGSTNLEFQGTNFSVKGDGHVATNGWIELGGRTAPAVSAVGDASFYYNLANQEIYFSYAGGAYTGLRAPVFNGVVTGLGAGAKTFQNSDGTFTIDYQGNGAFQSMALANGITTGAGAWGLTGTGSLTVSSCAGCSVDVFCAAAGTNTITCPGVPAPGSYTTGMSVSILIANINTGATTVNINSLGAKNILKNGAALSGGELTAGGTFTLQYDGTQFNISSTNSSPGGSNTHLQFNNSGAFGGSANLTWNNATQVLTATALNSSNASIYGKTGFIQSDIGFVALPGTATAFNAFQAPNGGMQALSFTASNYIQSGSGGSTPSPTISDSFRPGALFYNTTSVCEQVFSGVTWGCLLGNGGPAQLLSLAVGTMSQFTVNTSGFISSSAGANFGTTGTGSLAVGNNNGSTATAGGGFAAASTLAAFAIAEYDTGGHCNIGTAFGAGGIGCTSDVRLKKDIVPLGSALTAVNALKPVSFRWKGNDQQSIGFVAQDVQKVLPALVSTGPDGYLVLGQNELVPYLVRAIQEQQREITDLQRRVK